MRISDWSSDVCSSDLVYATARAELDGPIANACHSRGARSLRAYGSYSIILALIIQVHISGYEQRRINHWLKQRSHANKIPDRISRIAAHNVRKDQIGRASCRASVCQYV